LSFDHWDTGLQLKSSGIGLDLADVESFTPTLMHVLPQICGTRRNRMYDCLLDKLETAFPVLWRLNPERTAAVVASTLRPVPDTVTSRRLALRFLCSVPRKVLAEMPVVFNTTAVIETCVASGQCSLLPELKALIAWVGRATGALDMDWIGDGVPLAIELCRSIMPEILIELVEFQNVPYDAMPRLIDRLAGAGARASRARVFIRPFDRPPVARARIWPRPKRRQSSPGGVGMG